jgi:hypothetical protein
MIKDRKNKSVDYFPSWGGEEWNTLHNQAREKKNTSCGASQNALGNSLNVGAVLYELDIILDEQL